METVLKQIGSGKYVTNAKILSWIGTNYSLDTEPLRDMKRDQLLNLAQKLWADGMGTRSDEEDVEEDSDSDEGSCSDSGYTSDALENQFSLISFSGSFKAQGKAQKVKAQVKAELKATPEPHAMEKKKTKPTMGNGKNKSKNMGTARTTRSRAKAQLADPGTFSNSDSDPVIKTHSLKRFAAL
jgi:hypothetical protein